jgi:hypothetical protein
MPPLALATVPPLLWELPPLLWVAPPLPWTLPPLPDELFGLFELLQANATAAKEKTNALQHHESSVRDFIKEPPGGSHRRVRGRARQGRPRRDRFRFLPR